MMSGIAHILQLAAAELFYFGIATIIILLRAPLIATVNTIVEVFLQPWQNHPITALTLIVYIMDV